MSRTKSRRKSIPVGPGTHDICSCSDGKRYRKWRSTPSNTGEYETITYETGSRKTKGYMHSKSCAHTAWSITQYPLTVNWASGKSRFHQADGITGYAKISLTSHDLVWTEPTVQETESFNERAYQAMEPSLESSLNLTNFLVELSDLGLLRSMIGKWYKVLRGAPLKQFYRSGKSTDAVIREGASAHLMWNFGIKPFVSDCTKLYHRLTNYQEILDDFLERRGKVQVRHYREETEEQLGPKVISSYGAERKTWHEMSRKTNWHATMVYLYDSPDVVTVRDRIRVLRDVVGLRLTAANIWEAIPFSFVVDWFFNVGDFLDAYKKPLYPVNLTVIDYCYSRKTVAKFQRSFEGSASCRSAGGTRIVTSKGWRKSYVRKRAVPRVDISLGKSGRFGRHQLALSASLFAVNRR